MKPLLSVISYNRKAETLATLRSLARTGAMSMAECVYVDNDSTDGTFEAVTQAFIEEGWPIDWICKSSNIGCPRALNLVLARRKPGQHFIKVDNDVELETDGWIPFLCNLLETNPDVAIASPWYTELETSNQGRLIQNHGYWHEYFPVVGHCAIHAGWFLDETGAFDVLTKDHLYGFEDLLMAHRAAARGYKCAVDMRVKLRNVQRKNSLDSSDHNGETREQHIARLRPLYDQRRAMAHMLKDAYYVSLNGEWRDSRATDPIPGIAGALLPNEVQI